MSEKQDAETASLHRLLREQTSAQNREFREETLLSGILDRLQGLLCVVNEQRQVVYANPPFLEFVGAGGMGELCGMRPGEIMRCVHASESEQGCGESESCRFCGAVQAITETLRTNAASTRECRITSVTEGKTNAGDFKVRTMPFEIAGNRYVLASFRDVSGQKRKNALERIFFHDILNTASSIKVYLELLENGISDNESRKLIERLHAISDTLIEEIRSQKILVSAENRTLTVQRNLIDSRSFIRQVIQQFEDQDVARGKKIVIAEFSESIAFISDDSLLRRVLTNMMKNALEASTQGQTVSVGFRPLEGAGVRIWIHNPAFIEEEIQRQIFQRYFSTKGEDRGLGAYGMKLLTEEYLDGRVSFESTREGGTTFTVTLPLQPGGSH